jgi:hypothetical protein
LDVYVNTLRKIDNVTMTNACAATTAALPPKLFISSNLQQNHLFEPPFSIPIQIISILKSPTTANMLRTFTRNTVVKTFKPSSAPASLRVRGMANKRVEDITQAAGEAKDTNPKDPSVISSAGAVGKQFNPDGNIGQVGEAVRITPCLTTFQQ